MRGAWLDARMDEPDDDDATRALGAWLARWRAEVGVSQRKLAAMAGVDQGGISRVERGLQACGSRRLARLILTLDLLAFSRMTGETPPPIRPRRKNLPPGS